MSGNVPDSARNVEVRMGVSGECALFPGTGVTAPLNPGPALRLWELRIQNEVQCGQSSPSQR